MSVRALQEDGDELVEGKQKTRTLQVQLERSSRQVIKNLQNSSEFKDILNIEYGANFLDTFMTYWENIVEEIDHIVLGNRRWPFLLDFPTSPSKMITYKTKNKFQHTACCMLVCAVLIICSSLSLNFFGLCLSI